MIDKGYERKNIEFPPEWGKSRAAPPPEPKKSFVSRAGQKISGLFR
jgi:hypothetical protein